MFGRVPQLPVDLMFKNVLHDDSICDYDTYVKSLMYDLRSAMVLAQDNSADEQRHQSEQYDKKVKGLPLLVGDQVLVANKGARGKRKLSDKWEPVVYNVVTCKPDLHIYRIRDLAGNERTVHRNLLLQVNFLPLDVSLDVSENQPTASVVTAPEEPDTSMVDGGSTLAMTYHHETPPSVSEVDDDHTAPWVRHHSPAEREGLPPPDESSPAFVGWAGAGAPLIPSYEL